jgi:hypothetical protein
MASTAQKLDTTFYDETEKRLSNASFLNLFDILLDTDRSTKFMNIFKSYVVNDQATTDIIFFDSYEVEDPAWWDDISWKIYGTPNLWWVIALMNNIVNPFEELEVGSNIKVLKPDFLYIVLKDIERLKEL